MNKKAAIEKIKKCLALSNSDNEHEAENALRQAQLLMEKYNIDDEDMLAAEATEAHAKSGAQNKPAEWEWQLASTIASLFGCEYFFSNNYRGKGDFKFIGCGLAPEIASYAFAVLFRQCKKARANYIKTKLKRCKTSTKTKRADLFRKGWIITATKKVNKLATTERQQEAMQSYLAKHYPSLVPVKPKKSKKGNASKRDMSDFYAGWDQGSDAVLNQGMGAEEQKAIV